jgi:hypothetical protein
MIVKRGGKFRVVSEHGGKNLGESKTKEGAVKRLRQVEYFKHHSKAIVDPDLLKQATLSGSSRGMVSYVPVVFRSNAKKVDQEAEKLDFPSTGKKMDLRDVKQPEFPSTPYPGEPLASTFGNLRPSPPAKDGAVLAIQPSSGHYEAGSYRGEHGPDTQYKGSDYVPESVKKKLRARKSITIAGRKVVLVKGEGGGNAYLRDSYPIDKGAEPFGRVDPEKESEKRRAERLHGKMKDKLDAYERAKREDERAAPYARDARQIAMDPDEHYLGRSIKIKLKKANKSIANLVLQYTQNQPLGYPFKPLVAYLVKEDDVKDPEKDGVKTTTFKKKHLGLSKAARSIFDQAQRQRTLPTVMTAGQEEAKKEAERQQKESDKSAVFGTKNWMIDPKKREAVKKLNPSMKSKKPSDSGPIPQKLLIGPWRSKNLDKEIDEQMAMPRKVVHDEEKKTAWKRSGYDTPPKQRGLMTNIPVGKDTKKSEMPETTVAPPKKRTISPAGTIVQMIKEKMAESDKKTQENTESKKSVIGPFRRPEGKRDSGYGAELRKRAEEFRKKEEEGKLRAKKETVKAVDPNPIKGGIGDHLQYDDVDEKELEVGTKIEQEHVGRNKQMSPEEKAAAGADIALDHLQEDEKYYTHLVEMERKAKAEKKQDTQKKKLLKEGTEKSVVKERKLQGVVGNAERMVKIREETNASPREMRVATGQLRAYSRKLAAEKKKNAAAIVKGGFKDKWIKEQESKGKDPLKTPEEEAAKKHPKDYAKREEIKDLHYKNKPEYKDKSDHESWGDYFKRM